ncbi:MAG: phage tail protein [Anaerolineales bacterium]|nr:phage tail protein [Anaerolineales bacterium]
MSEEQLRKTSNAAFRFILDVDGSPQAAFTECTLPVIEWEIEEVKEGGVNTFMHQLPGRRKGSRVSLKNGVGSSELVSWYLEAMKGTFSRKTVTITLLDMKLKTIMSWHVDKALPIKWTGPQLKTSDNSVAIQTLEFAGGEVTVTT